MMEIAQAKRMHAMVWQVRDELGDKWPTPNTEDSLAYAVTEVAEAIDADLRLTRPGDKRNNVRHMDVFDELGQAAMMLFTALGRDWAWSANWVPEVSEYDLPAIISFAANAWTLSVRGIETWKYTTLATINAIDIYCVGVESHLEAALRKAQEKWG